MIAPVLRETWKQWCKLQIYNCALLRQESICLSFTLSFVSSLHEQLKACLWLSMLARPLNVGQSYNGNTAEWWRTRVRAEVVDSFVWHRLHGERRYGCAMFTDNSVAFAFEEYMSYAGVAMRNQRKCNLSWWADWWCGTAGSRQTWHGSLRHAQFMVNLYAAMLCRLVMVVCHLSHVMQQSGCPGSRCLSLNTLLLKMMALANEAVARADVVHFLSAFEHYVYWWHWPV